MQGLRRVVVCMSMCVLIEVDVVSSEEAEDEDGTTPSASEKVDVSKMRKFHQVLEDLLACPACASMTIVYIVPSCDCSARRGHMFGGSGHHAHVHVFS